MGWEKFDYQWKSDPTLRKQSSQNFTKQTNCLSALCHRSYCESYHCAILIWLEVQISRGVAINCTVTYKLFRHGKQYFTGAPVRVPTSTPAASTGKPRPGADVQLPSHHRLPDPSWPTGECSRCYVSLQFTFARTVSS